MHELKRRSLIAIAMPAVTISLMIGIGNLSFPGDRLIQASAQVQGSGQGNGPLENGGPLQWAGPLQDPGPFGGTGLLQGSGPLPGAGPLQGNLAPILGGDPIGVGGPIMNFDGGPITLASLPPNLPTAPPADRPSAVPGLGPLTADPRDNLPASDPTPPSNPGPQDKPQIACETCFTPPAPWAPTPPPNNIVNCANVTCN
jgi:hypothetical protein